MLCFIALFSHKALANNISSIVNKVVANQASIPNQSFDVYMTTYSKDKEDTIKLYKERVTTSGNTQLSSIQVYKPAAFAGTTFKTEINLDNGAVKQWLLKSGETTQKMILPEYYGKSFLESDFNFYDYTISLNKKGRYSLKTENEEYYILENQLPDNHLSYSAINYHINKSNYTVEIVVFYDKNNKKSKVLHNKKIKKVGDGYVASYIEMIDLQKQSKTTLKRTSIQPSKNLKKN